MIQRCWRGMTSTVPYINCKEQIRVFLSLVVTGALKCYLRELPEPLMTCDLFNDWFQAAGCVGHLTLVAVPLFLPVGVHVCTEYGACVHREKALTEKLARLRKLLKKLPPENYNNLRCERPGTVGGAALKASQDCSTTYPTTSSFSHSRSSLSGT